MSQSRRSVFAWNGLRRHNRRLQAGIAKVKAGQSFRVGSETAGLGLNQFFSNFHCPTKPGQYRHTALTWLEEEEIVKKLLKQEHPGGVITFKAITEATFEVVRMLPLERRRRIRFKNLRPSKTFCKFFQKRHCYAIYCEKPIAINGVEDTIPTATEMAAYFQDLKEMIKDEKIHRKNVCCLTARTVRVDIGEGKRYIRFLTMFAVSNAVGDLLCYTHLVHNNDISQAAVESVEFQNWLPYMTKKIRELGFPSQSSEYRYNLLLCDDSSHFVTNILRDWLFLRQIIVYSIPGISDAFPGTHDVGCAKLWDTKFMEFLQMDMDMQSPPKNTWTETSILTYLHLARYAALTPRNISDSFGEVGIYPPDEVRFFKHPRPLSYNEPAKICDIAAMCDILDKAEKAADVVCVIAERD